MRIPPFFIKLFVGEKTPTKAALMYVVVKCLFCTFFFMQVIFQT